MGDGDLSPYQRIMRAAKAGLGVHLSKEEVFSMSMDAAISDLADSDDARPKRNWCPHHFHDHLDEYAAGSVCPRCGLK